MAVIDVWINCPDEAVALRISERLIGERLAACSNVFAPISSCFRWRGSVARETEVPLLVKTRAELFDALCLAVRAEHPYETPGIVGVPIAHVNRDYADWIVAETAAAPA